jgi:hypothetical protein
MTTFDMQLWLTRGDQLGCIDGRVAQARYASAWELGDANYVKGELERIFTRRHRMPALNWLARRSQIEGIDELEDAPPKLVEDWRDADFAIRIPDKGAVSPAWLQTPAAWERLLVAVTRSFVFAETAEKVALARRWCDDAVNMSWRRPVALAELVESASRARFLALSATASEAMRVIVPDHEALAAIADGLQARATALVAAWASVLSGPARPLTLTALRRCTTTFELDDLLAGATGPSTLNLMTYLRCRDLPANP